MAKSITQSEMKNIIVIAFRQQFGFSPAKKDIEITTYAKDGTDIYFFVHSHKYNLEVLKLSNGALWIPSCGIKQILTQVKTVEVKNV